jgi:hypothetical protein
MVRLRADENFNGDVTRGLLLRAPDVDLVRVQDVGLQGADDANVLAWAADNGRIVLTHDRSTMPKFAIERIKRRAPMSGLFVVNDRTSVRETIEEHLLIDGSSDPTDWDGRIVYLPL